jgi:hypothetical protein
MPSRPTSTISHPPGSSDDRGTKALLRPPAGEWVRLACRTYLADDGVGLAHADLFDPGGLVGEVAQPPLVRKRKPGNGVA